MKTIEELEQERLEKLAENKRRAEIMLGAEYVIEGQNIYWSNVEYRDTDDGDWIKIFTPDFNFDDYDYRLIRKPEMVELDFDDVPDLLGQRCICIKEYEYIEVGENCFIAGYSTEAEVVIVKSKKYESRPLYQELREHFTRPDGSRFEKEKK